jgi:hypothetical protein
MSPRPTRRELPSATEGKECCSRGQIKCSLAVIYFYERPLKTWNSVASARYLVWSHQVLFGWRPTAARTEPGGAPGPGGGQKAAGTRHPR